MLFPSDEQLAERGRGPDDVDEEAVTDIEMNDVHEHAHVEQTPQKSNHVRQHFAATPPPTATRATRSKKGVSPEKFSPAAPTAGLTPEAEAADSSFDSNASMSMGKKGKGKSPFDSWPRGKPGKRRAGDELAGEASGKRSRGAGAGMD